jgi:hypothetical protein
VFRSKRFLAADGSEGYGPKSDEARACSQSLTVAVTCFDCTFVVEIGATDTPAALAAKLAQALSAARSTQPAVTGGNPLSFLSFLP